MIYPGATNERTASVLLQLMKKEKTLKGKKVAVLGGANEANTVNKTIVPGLKKLGVKLGSTAVLSSGGASTDTSSAQAQLDSFIEKWKGEHVDAIFLSGNIVSAKDFVTKIKAAMPDVQLLVDNTDVRGPGRDMVAAGVTPNPYEGIIAAGGPTPAEYQKGPNWKYCAKVYKKYTGKKPQTPTQVVKKKRPAHRQLRDVERRVPGDDDVRRHRDEGRQEPRQRVVGEGGRHLRADHEPRLGPVLVAREGQVRRGGQLPARGVLVEGGRGWRLEGPHPGGEHAGHVTRPRPVPHPCDDSVKARSVP